MDVAQFVAEFGRAIDQRRATVLVGAGLSFDGGYPSWEGLLDGLRSDLGLDEGFDDLPKLAQYVENTLGREFLVAAVCETIASVAPIVAENHRLLAELPIDEIWTTNYDPLIEMAGSDDVVIELDDALAGADATRRRVYKMHGSVHPGVDRPVGGIRNLVISSDDFETYDRAHPRLWRLLQAQFLTSSFLYLGFSLSDPNFEAMVRLARLTTADRPSNHFALLKRRDGAGVEFDLRANDLERAGVTVVEIASHSEVTEVLRGLIARTKPSRLFVSGSQPTGVSDPPKVPMSGSVTPPAVSELDPALLGTATVLGRHLAGAGIRVATANLLGAEVGYALLDALGAAYDPDRLLLIRRTNQSPIDPPNRRRGSVTFFGENPTSMRAKLYTQTRAVVVLGGGSGAMAEVAASSAAGMGIVPLACTGGTAWKVWAAMSERLFDHRLGGSDIDAPTFARLDSPDLDVAIAAALTLICQAMFIPELS